jgi:hypothetical protein
MAPRSFDEHQLMVKRELSVMSAEPKQKGHFESILSSPQTSHPAVGADTRRTTRFRAPEPPARNPQQTHVMLRTVSTLAALLAVDAVPQTKVGKVQVYIMM